MQTINIPTLFKHFMDSVISDESMKCFVKYCLGVNVYSYFEYFDTLSNILKTRGEGYTFKYFIYTKRYNAVSFGHSDSLRTYLSQCSFFISDEKIQFAKMANRFNLYAINPGFPFIILPKLYKYIESSESDIEFNTGMIKLIEEWKEFFYPYVIDFCSFKKHYVPAKSMYVCKNKNDILITDDYKLRQDIKDENNKVVASYFLNTGGFKIHNILNYD